MSSRDIKDSWSSYDGACTTRQYCNDRIRLWFDIYFSESRRENALLKASEHGNVLRTIYKTDGEISQHFPKTLIDMSKLDGTFGCYSWELRDWHWGYDEAETSRTLMEEYQIPDISDSREANINRFMQFCGVGYLVSEISGVAILSWTHQDFHAWDGA
jgi:hypothetical protein